MSWTKTTRKQYRRDDLRYASDLTDDEWKVVAPLLPKRRRIGRPRKVDLRAVLNAILYILATGCQWRALPKEFPPRSSIGGTQALSHGRHHRQPKREDHRKWRSMRV